MFVAYSLETWSFKRGSEPTCRFGPVPAVHEGVRTFQAGENYGPYESETLAGTVNSRSAFGRPMLSKQDDSSDVHLHCELCRLAEKYPDRPVTGRYLVVARALFWASEMLLRVRFSRLADRLDAVSFEILVLGASREL